MDMPSVLGAPRHCYIGGEVYWVRPMTMSAMAIVMQWLDDVLPGRADRRMPPKIGDEASQKALGSFPGQVMLTWLALRNHGFSYSQAAGLVPHSPEDDENDSRHIEHLRVMDVFFARRRTMTKGEGGEDWSETWFAKSMADMCLEYGIEQVSNLTLDQFEWLSSGGKADEYAQFDLQAAADDLPRRLALIKEAMENGTMEVAPSTP